jgi:hypothetical protein
MKVPMENEIESMIELFAIYSLEVYNITKIVKGEKYYAFPNEYRLYDIIDIFTKDGTTMTFVGIYHKLNFVTLAVWRDMQINSILEE